MFSDPVEDAINPRAARSMQEMATAYQNETGQPMYITSGNRDYEEQKRLHPTWSEEKLRRSTHMHGTGYDINLAGKGKDSPMFKWLKKNGAKYGFKWPGYPHKTAGKEWWHWEYHA